MGIKIRETVTPSFLIASGGTESQIKGRVKGNANVGNDRHTLINPATQLLPYAGYSSLLIIQHIFNKNKPLYIGSFMPSFNPISMKQLFTFLCLCVLMANTSHAQTTYYVDAARADNSGAGTGWATAEKELQVAINEAVSGDQIWVKAGTYKPTLGTDRTICFSMKNGVAIYGGFIGTETLLTQRNEIYNLTILSGDLLGNDAGFTNNDENSYNVFRNSGLNNTAVLDGFTIRGGNANLTNFSTSSYGGAMYNASATPTIKNTLFLYNAAYTSGGAIYSLGGTSPITLYDCVFNNNTSIAGGIGSAIYTDNATITNSVFTGNTNGYGVIYTSKTLSLYNCTLAFNNSSEGLAVYGESAYVIVQNCVFSGNSYESTGTENNLFGISTSFAVSYSSFDGIFGGANNVFAASFLNVGNPAGADNIWRTADDGLRLACNSQGINTGINNTTCITGAPTTDILGLARIGNTDMGAYEGNHTDLATNAIATTNTIVYVDQNATGTTNYSDCSKQVAAVNSAGAYTIAGSVMAKVWLETTQPAQYVKRHYEITPAVNAATVTGKVTLYFIQQEFTDFNAVNTTKLPVDATDAANNKANLLIEKRPGTSSDGTGLPGTYTGTPVTINPADADIVWNATAARWEVSFDVTGFSGFFVKTQAAVLPLKLIGFTGSKINGTNVLAWNTTDEVNTKQFIIEWSMDAVNWNTLGTTAAKGGLSDSYTYDHTNVPSGKIFYRLKMVDQDGQFTYSNVIWLNGNDNTGIVIYPNPVKDALNINIGNTLLNTTAILANVEGKLLQHILITANQQQINVRLLPSGMYILTFADGTKEKFVKE